MAKANCYASTTEEGLHERHMVDSKAWFIGFQRGRTLGRCFVCSEGAGALENMCHKVSMPQYLT